MAGKRALVTGANSGIGEAIALTLGDAGADVAVNFVTHLDEAKAVAAAVCAKGRRVLVLRADVYAPDQVDAMFKAIDSAWDGIDILVNNAGVDGVAARAWEVDLDAWRRVIDVNLLGTFLCCREAL